MAQTPTRNVIADYSRAVFEQTALADKMHKAIDENRFVKDEDLRTPFPAAAASRMLLQAVPVFWTAEMNAVRQAYVDINPPELFNNHILQPYDLPYRNGFVWFEGGVTGITLGLDEPVLIKSLQWMSLQGKGLGISADGYPLPPTTRMPFFLLARWVFGERMLDGSEEFTLEGEPVASLLRALLLSVLGVMNQRLVTVSHERPNRAARKAWAAHSPHEPAIHVVQLRRTSNPEPKRDHDIVDWSCRWMVRPHWRMQRVGPGRAEVRPVLVNTYLKGPEGRPLKAPKPVLVEVSR